jgi:hypothetical protein
VSTGINVDVGVTVGVGVLVGVGVEVGIGVAVGGTIAGIAFTPIIMPQAMTGRNPNKNQVRREILCLFII